MRIPFSGQEIKTAAKKLKNGKSPGLDEINLEMIKYAPMSIFTEIAGIYNTVAKEGDTVSELKLGLLTPLQKPGKAKGPLANLRSLILLSVIRKILTICLIERI